MNLSRQTQVPWDDVVVKAHSPTERFVVRPGHLARFLATVYSAFALLTLLAVPPLIVTTGDPKGAAYMAAWLLAIGSLVFGVARTRACIKEGGTVIVRNWYRTHVIQAKEIADVEIGKGFLTPFHQQIRLTLHTGETVRVLASDRMTRERRDLPDIRERFEVSRRSATASPNTGP